MTLVTYPKDRTLVEDTMRRFGGIFEKRLADASLDADDGINFTRALTYCLRSADPDSTMRIKDAFPDIYRVMEDMSEDERLGLLYDTFPTIFDKYAQMAQAEVPV